MTCPLVPRFDAGGEILAELVSLAAEDSRCCDIEEASESWPGLAVERGNLPNSMQCDVSRFMTGNNTSTITPPLRREWSLTCQGLPAPQSSRPPFRNVMRMVESKAR